MMNDLWLKEPKYSENHSFVLCTNNARNYLCSEYVATASFEKLPWSKTILRFCCLGKTQIPYQCIRVPSGYQMKT